MNIHQKFNLGFFPTPLHKLENLSGKFKDYNLYIKRDDQTGLASGGNKTRKLEYLIFDALKSNCDTVITAGAQQSNHCRQTAAACAKAGLKCRLLLGGFEPDVYSGNLLLSHLLGAEIHFTGENRKGEDIEDLKDKLISENANPYVIPYGGSNITGALGFVNAVKELKDQLENEDLIIDYIFFASSSGGTQAGLILGKMLYGLSAEYMPINIDKDEAQDTLEEIVNNLVKEGRYCLNIDRKIKKADFKLIKDYDKAGYGVVTEDEKNAIKMLAENEGILLDPVYTGRAFFAMLDHLEKAKLKTGSKVLFWHTGGLPSIFNLPM